VRRDWPLKYWGLVPFDQSRIDWKMRYASVSGVANPSACRSRASIFVGRSILLQFVRLILPKIVAAAVRDGSGGFGARLAGSAMRTGRYRLIGDVVDVWGGYRDAPAVRAAAFDPAKRVAYSASSA
jgi:hypothetical protein